MNLKTLMCANGNEKPALMVGAVLQLFSVDLDLV
jgi:hypothetical protein